MKWGWVDVGCVWARACEENFNRKPSDADPRYPGPFFFNAYHTNQNMDTCGVSSLNGWFQSDLFLWILVYWFTVDVAWVLGHLWAFPSPGIWEMTSGILEGV